MCRPPLTVGTSCAPLMKRYRFLSPWWRIAVGVLMAGWSACRSGMPPGATIVRLEVPFIAQQTDRDCGRTSLRIVLRYAGIALDPEDLGRPEGVLPFEIEQYLQDHGIPFTHTAARPDALLNVLYRGQPVLLLLNLSRGPWQRYHYVVLVGAVVRRGRIHAWQIHDGRTPYRVVSARWLWSRWAGAHFWGVVIQRYKPRRHRGQGGKGKTGKGRIGNSLRELRASVVSTSEIRNPQSEISGGSFFVTTAVRG